MSTLIMPRAVADELGVQYDTLRTWRNRKRGPQYVGEGRMIRYTREAVDDYRELLGWPRLGEAS